MLQRLEPFKRLGGRLFWRDGILLIPLAALVTSSPRIVRGVTCGHDFDFHLVSWLETQRSWSQGVFYPHWAQTPNWAAGEPRFVFYPPLTWMLGALLGYLMSWDWVPAAMTLLCLVAVGFTTRALAGRLVSAPSATVAGIVATTTPYGLFTAYERTAFGELAAAALIPLLLLFAWRQRSSRVLSGRAFDGSTSLLALTLAAIWLTNAPAGVIASYLLAFAALSAAIVQKRWWPILRAAVAAPIAFGLAAFYLVPAAVEQRWIFIQQAMDVGMRVRDSWLFARHPSPDLELHDQVLRLASSIVVFTVVLALLGFGVSLLRRKLPKEKVGFWIPLALLIPIVFFLQLPFSAVLWNDLPKLSFLQFPWRLLIVLAVPYAIFLGAATPLESRRARISSFLGWGLALGMIACVSSLLFFQFCDDDDDVGNQVAVFRVNSGTAGTDEYAAIGSDNSLIASGLPDACLVSDPGEDLGESDSGSAPVWYAEQGSCDQTFTAQVSQVEHKELQVESDHDGYLVLRLSRYPAWKITNNGVSIPSQGHREDGLIEIPISEGPSHIDVVWLTTPDQWWGRGISGLAFVFLIALWQFERNSSARDDVK
jgi:hypothetical protein